MMLGTLIRRLATLAAVGAYGCGQDPAGLAAEALEEGASRRLPMLPVAQNFAGPEPASGSEASNGEADGGDDAAPASLRDLLAGLASNASQLWQAGEIALEAADVAGSDGDSASTLAGGGDATFEDRTRELRDAMASTFERTGEPAPGADGAAAAAASWAVDPKVSDLRRELALVLAGDYSQHIAAQLQAAITAIATGEGLRLPAAATDGNQAALSDLADTSKDRLKARLLRAQGDTVKRSRHLMRSIRRDYRRMANSRFSEHFAKTFDLLHRGLAVFHHLQSWEDEILHDPMHALEFASGLYDATTDTNDGGGSIHANGPVSGPDPSEASDDSLSTDEEPAASAGCSEMSAAYGELLVDR